MENKKNEKKDFAFIKPLKVTKSKNGNVLVYINYTTAISLHPNYLKAILDNSKKAS